MSRISNTPAFFAAQKNVTTSGTPVALAANTIPDGAKLVVKAKSGNTGTITVGNSSTNALNTGTTSVRLAQNQSVELQVNNSELVWIDATVSGEGVEYFSEAHA